MEELWRKKALAELMCPTVYVGGVWPVYWLTLMEAPVQPYISERTTYFIGKRRLLGAMARLKFAHPNARFIYA